MSRPRVASDGLHAALRRLRRPALTVPLAIGIWAAAMAASAASAAAPREPVSRTTAAASRATSLPPAVQSALLQARIPPEAMAVYVVEVGQQEGTPPRLALHERQPMNPASLMKLYTTGAALELLGPAWTWTTPVLTTGTVDRGVLSGDLVIQGRGDPTLTLERLWLLLRQLQQRGVREVRGDIVLDSSAFALTATEQGEAGDFDGERFRPYNVRPDALMFNLKALTLQWLPDPPHGVAHITSDLALAGVQIDATVPLMAGDCGDWRSTLQADFNDAARLHFAGGYPANCGDKTWPLAYSDPRSFNARMIGALWLEVGGAIGGRVRSGITPPEAQPLFDAHSPPLASVVRDIDKFSNNVMAQQLFLTLGLELGAPSQPQAIGPPSMRPAFPPEPATTAEAARAVLRKQFGERIGCHAPELVIDNGSGLSRSGRTSARCLGQWLQVLWSSPVMPELMSALPITGLDGTTSGTDRRWGTALGRAHLKTGSLRDTTGLAGYVLARSGRRYALVAIVNHPDAAAARAALDAMVRWVNEDDRH